MLELAGRSTWYWILATLLQVSSTTQAQSAPDNRVMEIHGIHFDPPVITQGQAFTVTLSGYNVSAFEQDYFFDPSGVVNAETYTVSVEGDRVLMDSQGAGVCTSPALRLPEAVSPQQRRYAIQGLSAGTYTFEVQHSVACGFHTTMASRTLTVYEQNDTARVFNLEAPAANQRVSGVGLIRGWACYQKDDNKSFSGPEIGAITYQVDDGPRQRLAHPTSRSDTQVVCGEGNVQTGFGTVDYWGNLGVGQHTFSLYIDDELVLSRDFYVEAPEEGFLKGLEAEYELADFPSPGKTARVKWSQSDQNFIVVEYK